MFGATVIGGFVAFVSDGMARHHRFQQGYITKTLRFRSVGARFERTVEQVISGNRGG